MHRARDYRNHAQYCRDHAALLSSAPEKALWLRIAEEWERLAENKGGGNQGPQLAEQPGAAVTSCSMKSTYALNGKG